jgi:CubicO group peptidase (beta-lactamase class C family)
MKYDFREMEMPMGRLAGILALCGLALPGLTMCRAQRPAPRRNQTDALFAGLISPQEPGAAVLVVREGRVVFERGYGVSDLRTRREIDGRTNFRLASVTKQFTAASVMLLVRDGKLRYEDNLTDIFPDFPEYGRAITVRQLLNHTSGLPDYEDLMPPVDPFADVKPRLSRRGREARLRVDPEQAPAFMPGSRGVDPSLPVEQIQIKDAGVLELLKGQKAGKFPPGSRWAYSNSGYVVLGLVVEKAGGRPFADFLRDRIFGPLGMEDSVAYERGRNEVPGRAYGHSKDGGRWAETDQSPTSATLGDGGVYSSLADLFKWDEALRLRTLLGETETRLATTPARVPEGPPEEPDGTPAEYGFGWFLNSWKGHARMWHYGETIGFRTAIQRFTADGLTVIVLCNRSDLDARSLALRVADLHLGGGE